MAAKENFILIEPIFGYSKNGNIPYHPTIREIFTEWIDAINFLKYPSRILIALNFAFHFVTFIITIVFLAKFASLPNVFFVIVATVCFLTVYNTVWFHRYCSHASFQFKRLSYTRFFLWSNPIVFREECYAIPHQIHHQRSDKAGDPYGPHLGWLGSHLAIESSQKLNIEISEKMFESLARSVSHIGFPINSYHQFKATGLIERTSYYLSRALFAQLMWGTVFFTLGGMHLLLGWYTSIFALTFLVRDFNWRGHGGNFRYEKKSRRKFDTKSRALNQWFYGYFASEWHDNHHKCPHSANNGFLRDQIDIAFQIIRLMHKLGIVKSYMDAGPIFEKECLVPAAKT